MKYLFLAFIATNSFAGDSFFGNTRSGADCSLTLEQENGSLAHPSMDMKVSADFALIKNGINHESLNIPGKFVTYRENGQILLNQKVVAFEYGNLKAFVHLNNKSRPVFYTYEYYRSPNYIQVECYLN